jgi:hypothetical protein
MSVTAPVNRGREKSAHVNLPPLAVPMMPDPFNRKVFRVASQVSTVKREGSYCKQSKSLPRFPIDGLTVLAVTAAQVHGADLLSPANCSRIS